MNRTALLFASEWVLYERLNRAAQEAYRRRMERLTEGEEE